MICDLSVYIKGNASICREERQLALYLNEKLKSQKVMEVAGKAYDIEKVYFEVALMRDFFHSLENNDGDFSKGDFNDLLLKYCNEILQNEISYNVIEKQTVSDAKRSRHLNNWEHGTYPYLARCMMNAKPDIGLLLHREGYRYFGFVECKFESDIGIYRYEREKYNQLEVQGHILNFLCDNIFLGMKYNGKPIEKVPVRIKGINTRGEGVVLAVMGTDRSKLKGMTGKLMAEKSIMKIDRLHDTSSVVSIDTDGIMTIT